MLFSTGLLNRRHYYYSLNNNGINFIKGKLGITEQKVQPRTRAPRAEAFEAPEEERKGGDRKGGFRGRGFGERRGDGERRPRTDRGDAAKKEEAPVETKA